MKHMTLGLGVGALALALVIGGAQAQSPVKAGTLSCDVSGGIGMIITSKKTMSCRYMPVTPGKKAETYRGSIEKFGLDIGSTKASRMVWAVFAAGSPAPGALAGSYGGATAEATVSVGLGANVLVGGSNRSIALQPVSVTGQRGLNLAAGVAVLRLASLR